MKVAIRNQQNKLKFNINLLQKIVKAAAKSLLLPEGEISIFFTDDETIRKYNYEYRGLKRATNVLTFPLYEPVEENIYNPNSNLLGDIIISTPAVIRRAKNHNRNITEEFLETLIHGLLHLENQLDHINRQQRKKWREKQQQLFQATYNKWFTEINNKLIANHKELQT